MSNENPFEREKENRFIKNSRREFYFIETRAMLRNRLRKSTGGKKKI